MIDTIDLHQEKQANFRVMICQLDSHSYQWSRSSGLSIIQVNEKLKSKITQLLKIARQNSVDLIIFPEAGVPEELIGLMQEWSRGQNAIAICGSHYHRTERGYISRCPVIINGVVYFTEKVSLSPFERSAIIGEGLQKGEKSLKFINTRVGNFAVLICADYLNVQLKVNMNLGDLDLLCVPAFQRDSMQYYSRMNQEVQESSKGIYILYSNFYAKDKSDGRSAVFGLMDRIFTNELFDRKFTDSQPVNKIYELPRNEEFIIAELDLLHKRPFINHNIDSAPNVRFLPVSQRANASGLKFAQKIARDDERYERIEELYVPPREFGEIVDTLENKHIVFIVGDPGVGKTYSAVMLLKHYYEKGYEPIWFTGLEKEDRELQSKVLTEFIPANKQVVYFEDPFGKTVFERRDSLFQVFAPLLEKLSRLDSKIIITSRKEPFETFSLESLLEKDVLRLKQELNVRNPSYTSEDLFDIFEKLASVTCSWSEDSVLNALVRSAIRDGKLSTPLALRELIFAHKETPTALELEESIDRREDDTIKVFALEIRGTGLSVKIVLYLAMLAGNKGKAALSSIYEHVARALQQQNYPVASFSFAMEIRSQLGYRLEQFGYLQSIYKFTHPVYEEALAALIIGDPICGLTAKLVITEIAKVDPRHAYLLINRFVVKYPEMAVLLFEHLFENEKLAADDGTLLALARKLIATYYLTKNEDYFDLAIKCYPLQKVVSDLNRNNFSPVDLMHKLNLILRYRNNSPKTFDSSEINNLDWPTIFGNEKNIFGKSGKVLIVFQTCAAIDEQSIPIIIKQKGINFLKQIYFLLDKNNRKNFKEVLEHLHIVHHLEQYDEQLDLIEQDSSSDRFRFFKEVLFTDHRYSGRVFIDEGAQFAIRRNWVNLLPAGIVGIEGDFSAGDIIGICDKNKKLIAVGIAEYNAEQLKKIKGYSSPQFQELIGYYHTACAVQSRFLFKFNSRLKNDAPSWTFLLKATNKLRK